jgi:hypothetical protein
MKMKIKNYLLLLLFITTEMFANGGSIYSRFGLGDYYHSFTARRLALGELGYAIADYDYLNYLNPASWSKLRLSRVETGMIYFGNKISSANSSVFHAQTILTGAVFGFPIDHELGISLAAGIIPHSNVDYNIKQIETNSITGDYKTEYYGEGGLSKAFLGFSVNLPFDFSGGAALNYYTGRVERTSSVEFISNISLFNSSFSDVSSYHGVGYTFGLISSDFSKLFNVDWLKNLRLGFTYSNSSKIVTDTTNFSTTLVGSIETSNGSYKTEIPHRIGVGLTFTINDRYMFVADYLSEPLSQFKVNGKSSSFLRDLSKFSFGMEYRNPDLRSQSFWEQIMLRGGLSFEQAQYTFNGKGINQFSFYGGLSMPLGFDNTIDFGFQYGKRGTTENNLLTDNFYKFSITLSIGELWFIRTER